MRLKQNKTKISATYFPKYLFDSIVVMAFCKIKDITMRSISYLFIYLFIDGKSSVKSSSQVISGFQNIMKGWGLVPNPEVRKGYIALRYNVANTGRNESTGECM